MGEPVLSGELLQRDTKYGLGGVLRLLPSVSGVLSDLKPGCDNQVVR